MSTSLNGTSVAILATSGFEESELVQPKRALEDAGASVHVISPESGQIKGWDEGDWGDTVEVDIPGVGRLLSPVRDEMSTITA